MQSIPQGLQPLNTLIQTAPPTQTYAQSTQAIFQPQEVYLQDQTQWQAPSQGIPATWPAAGNPDPATSYPQQPVQYTQTPYAGYPQQPAQYTQTPYAGYPQQPVQYAQDPYAGYAQQSVAMPSYATAQAPMEMKKSGFPLPHTLGGAVLGAVIGSKWKGRPILGAAIGGAIGLTVGVISNP